MANPNFSIEEILNHDCVEFEQAYRIIQDRIPFEERSDILDFISTLDNRKKGKLAPDNYHMLVAAKNSEVLGAITGYYINEINSGFVNTLGVKAGYEGIGIGSSLRGNLVNKFKEDSENINGIIGEVEITNPWLKKLVSNPKIFTFDINYIQPPLRKVQNSRSLVLYLQREKSIEKMSTKKVIKIIEAIYKNIYDIENPQDNKYFNLILKSMGNIKYISRKTI